MKLLAKHLKQHRLDLLAKQGYRCAICSDPCTPEQAVLDHNHRAPGNVRGVLHRNCNGLLGAIENNRYGVRNMPGFLNGAWTYLQQPPSDLVHPTFYTPEEKKARAKAKAKKKTLKRKDRS